MNCVFPILTLGLGFGSRLKGGDELAAEGGMHENKSSVTVLLALHGKAISLHRHQTSKTAPLAWQ